MNAKPALEPRITVSEVKSRPADTPLDSITVQPSDGRPLLTGLDAVEFLRQVQERQERKLNLEDE